MSALSIDLRHAFRRLRARPLESAVIVLTLTLALGANTAVFTVLHSVLLTPLPYGRPARLVALFEVQTRAGLRGQPVAFANLQDWEASIHSFESIAAAKPIALTLTDGPDPERVSGLRVTTGMLRTLGIRPQLGRDFADAEATPGHDAVAMVSHELWQRAFGADRGVIGRILHLDGRPYEVVGVLPPGVRYPGVRVPVDGSDVWIPFIATPGEQRRFFHSLRVVARLREDRSRAQAEEELNAVAAALERQYPDTNTGSSTEVIGLQDALTADTAPVLWLLTAAVSSLLLLACLNIASVSLAAMMARRGELAIRVSLGASRWALCRQVIVEGVVLAGAGGVAGLLVAHWAVPLLVSLGRGAIPRSEEIAIRPGVAIWSAACTLVAALVFSGIPALVYSRASGQHAFGTRRGSVEGVSSQRLLRLLTVAEIALAVVLLTGTGLMLRSLSRASQVDVGFEPGGVVTASLNLPLRSYPDQASQARFLERYLDALHAVPGIGEAAILLRLPFGGRAATTFVPRGRTFAKGEEPWADYRTASERTFSVLRVRLIAGRVFTEHDSETSPDVVVVNATLAKRFWPGEDPVGRQLQIGDERQRWRLVVGVVGDVRMASVERDVEPAIYVPYRQNSWSNALAAGFVVFRPTGRNVDPLPPARRVLRSLDAQTALADGRALEDLVSGALGQRRFGTTLFTFFGVFGYILAALGVYGVVSNIVSRRAYELAVRAALGEPRARAFRDVIGQGLAMGLAGCVVGAGLVIPLAARVASQLYGVKPYDVPTAAGTIGMLIAVSAAACVLPGRRAIATDPLGAMRGDAA